MELELAEILARQLMDLYGLDAWQFRFNRSKRLLGICREGIKTIELSKDYVVGNSQEHVQDTIMHEIAHALVGAGHGHDEVWQAMCIRLGCLPKACDNTAMLPEGVWQARCAGCLTLFHRYRKPRHLRGIYCKRCGPEKGSLIFVNVKNRRITASRPKVVKGIKLPRQLSFLFE